MVLVFALSLFQGASLEKRSWSFDREPIGKAPSGFEAVRTGNGGEGEWVVEAVPDAPSLPNVVRQASTDDTRYRFPILVPSESAVEDGAVAVRFKTISGKVDQAGGLVFRYRDRDNYYVVRANALEDNVVLYKVVEGKRSSLAPRGAPADTYGIDQPVPPGSWHQLRVEFRGPLFSVYFDGEKLFDLEDHTFTGAGKVGLWTKADSVTLFDDLELEP